MVETFQADRFPARERFGVGDAGQMSPKAGAVDHGVDHAGFAFGLVVNQLRMVASQGGQLGVKRVGNVDDEARPFDDLEMHAKIIENSTRMKRRPGMSDFVSLLQNRASSTSLVAARWSGWASSQ